LAIEAEIALSLRRELVTLVVRKAIFLAIALALTLLKLMTKKTVLSLFFFFCNG